MLNLVLLILAETHSASWLFAIAELLDKAAKPLAVAAMVAVVISVTILRRLSPRDCNPLGINFFRRSVPDESDQHKVRHQLLKIIRCEIKCRLETSLYERVKFDLPIEDQWQQVGHFRGDIPREMSATAAIEITSLNRCLQSFRTPTLSPMPLVSIQALGEVFVRPDIQGRLLLLGASGAGKTTTLLHLAKDLVERASQDDGLPIPLILELSTWTENKSIEQWLTETLEKRYGMPASISQQWQQDVLPLLDGLDELSLLKQQKCIDEINAFLSEKTHHGLVICCRCEDYEASRGKLHGFNGGVYLMPLPLEQVRAFLHQLNCPYLWERIREDSGLQELAQKPLFLSMLTVTHQSNTITDEAALFDAFIVQKIREDDSGNIYSSDKKPNASQTYVYLAWLAQQLESMRAAEFAIEGLQPSMLSPNEVYLYQLIYGALYGLCFGLCFRLDGALLLGLLFGLSSGLRPARQLSETLMFSCSKALNKGLRFGLRAGLFVGLTLGLVCGLFAWLFAGLLAGLLLLLIIGGSFGLLVGLLVGLISGLRRGLIDEKIFPNQGIWRSLQNSITVILIFGLSFGLSGGLLFGLGFGLNGWLYGDLREGLSVGFSGGLNMGFFLGLELGLLYELIGPTDIKHVWLNGGLQSVLQHLALRIVLTKNGHIPWNYARFLKHAVELSFMQRFGGRYRFTHDLLRKHVARHAFDASLE
ncbi:MAG: NACHT domain-containing protein [Cyanobacteria bacterium P01_D01_bin.156]